MTTKEDEEPLIPESIVKQAAIDAANLDWLAIPYDQRIISDEWLETYCDIPTSSDMFDDDPPGVENQ